VVELLSGAGDQVAGIEAGLDLLARARESAAGRVNDELVPVKVDRGTQALVGKQPVDGRELA
jgi:hypothetical protein